MIAADNWFERTKSGTADARMLRTKGLSRAAKHLWYDFLRTYPLRFRRQEVIGSYTVDFFCYKAHTAIEILTNLSRSAEEQTQKRLTLQAYDIRILYIRDTDIENDFPRVCAQIDSFVRTALSVHPSAR